MAVPALQPGRVAVPNLIRQLNDPLPVEAHAIRSPSEYKQYAATANPNTPIGLMHAFGQTLFDMVLNVTQKERSITLRPNYPADPYKPISSDTPMGAGRVNILA